MSSKKVNIEIKPSEYCFDEEHFEIGGFVCPNCNGRKVFVETIGHDEFMTKECSNCNGTGKVKAVVSIKWKSD